MKKTELAKAIIKKYSVEQQIEKMIEEGAELTVALCHLKQKRVVLDRVAEEIADCLLVLNQMDIIFGELTFKEKEIINYLNKPVQIFAIIGDIQALLSVNYAKKKFKIKQLKELFYCFREKLKTLTIEIGEEKIGDWKEKKRNRMIERLENI